MAFVVAALMIVALLIAAAFGVARAQEATVERPRRKRRG
jgi:hypothetical protein